MNNRILIAFFSRAGENYFGGVKKYIEVGNTEIVCNKIKELTGADTFKIEMCTPYSDVYNTCIAEAKKDLQEGVHPELKSYPDNLDAYDTLILAYPNYWGTIPMAVASFLEKYDFSGKTVLPLCTNEGSGMGSSERDVQKYAPGAALRKGLSVTGSRASQSGKDIEKWLRSNGVL